MKLTKEQIKNSAMLRDHICGYLSEAAPGMEGRIYVSNLLDTIETLESELLTREASAYRGASEHIKDGAWDDSGLCVNPDLDELAEEIAAMNHADTQRAFDLAIAKGVKDTLQKMCDTAEMFGDPYKIFGLLKDSLEAANSEVERLKSKPGSAG